MTINKAFKTEISLSNLLEPTLPQWFGNNRFIYNTSLFKIHELSEQIKEKTIPKVNIYSKGFIQKLGTQIADELLELLRYKI
jgi:hypothetical protein